MTYSQNANPNATNSELDSKRIITHKELTSTQRDELIQQFVELVVDNMDRKTMEEWITDELIFQHGKLTKEELKERVDCFDEELFEELVDNVTQQYPKQLNTFEKETFIDINNTGGKF